AILPVLLDPVDRFLMFGGCEIHTSNPCSCGPAPAAAADEQGSCCCCRDRSTAGRRLTRSSQYDLIDLRMQSIRPALHPNIVTIDRRIAIRNARGRLRIHGHSQPLSEGGLPWHCRNFFSPRLPCLLLDRADNTEGGLAKKMGSRANLFR